MCPGYIFDIGNFEISVFEMLRVDSRSVSDWWTVKEGHLFNGVKRIKSPDSGSTRIFEIRVDP